MAFFSKAMTCEGTIDQLGVSREHNNHTKYTFIRINGKMFKNVVIDDYLDSFVGAGKYVTLSLHGNPSGSRVFGLKTADGEVHTLGNSAYIEMLFLMGFFLVAGLIFGGLVFLSGHTWGYGTAANIITGLIVILALVAFVNTPRAWIKAMHALK